MIGWLVALDPLETPADDNNHSCSACNNDSESKGMVRIRAGEGKLQLFSLQWQQQQNRNFVRNEKIFRKDCIRGLGLGAWFMTMRLLI